MAAKNGIGKELAEMLRSIVPEHLAGAQAQRQHRAAPNLALVLN